MQALVSATRAPAAALAVAAPDLAHRAPCGSSSSSTRLLLDGGRRRRLALLGGQSRRGVVVMNASESNVETTQQQTPTSPAEAVNLGLALFSKGRVHHGIPHPLNSLGHVDAH